MRKLFLVFCLSGGLFASAFLMGASPVYVTGGHIIIDTTATPTITRTPGVGTPTASPTPFMTPLGAQIISADSNGAVTFFTGGRETIGWSIYGWPSHTCSIQTNFYPYSQMGTDTTLIANSGTNRMTTGAIANLGPTNPCFIFSNNIQVLNFGDSSHLNALYVRAYVTPTTTTIITWCFYPVFTTSMLPKKYQYLFAAGYAKKHGFKIYWVAYANKGMRTFYKPAFVRVG